METKELTPTEIQVLVNLAKEKHDTKKTEIYQLLDEIDKLGDEVNSKEEELVKIESEYVGLMEKMVNYGI